MDARPTVPAKSRPGRPRALDDDAERRLLLDAGYRVMRQNGFEDASVGDVLAEAGLSTRAFYRHFASKDDLVLAMSRRDAARIAARIDERLETAATSIDALHAWVDEVLAIAYEPRRAARVGVLAAASTRRATGYTAEAARWIESLIAPLRTVLQRGRVDGSMPGADPAHDAPSIYAITWAAAESRLHGDNTLDRAAATAHVLRFCRSALGIAP